MFAIDEWVGIRPVKDVGQVKDFSQVEDLYDVLRKMGVAIEKYPPQDLIKLEYNWSSFQEIVDYGSGRVLKTSTKYRLFRSKGQDVGRVISRVSRLVDGHPMGRLPREAVPKLGKISTSKE